MDKKKKFACCLYVILLCLVSISSQSYCAGHKYTPESLRSTMNGADYIVVAPEAFMDALAPLLDKRAAEGLRVVAVTPEDISNEFTRAATGAQTILSFVRYAYFHWQAPAPKYLLIVGDAAKTDSGEAGDVTVPTFFVHTQVSPQNRFR